MQFSTRSASPRPTSGLSNLSRQRLVARASRHIHATDTPTSRYLSSPLSHLTNSPATSSFHSKYKVEKLAGLPSKSAMLVLGIGCVARHPDTRILKTKAKSFRSRRGCRPARPVFIDLGGKRKFGGIYPRNCHSQPFVRAMRAASTRLFAPSLLIASDR